jgi:membrane associated rhomboid family serine protease
MVVPAPTPPRSVARVLPRAPFRSALVMLLLTAGLYVIEAVDTVTGSSLQANGIEPLEVDGLDGVLWAPLLHNTWGHLMANTVPFLVFGFLAMSGGIRQFLVVTATIWVFGGLGVWLTGGIGVDDDGATIVHIGASGLIFGWLVFLLTRGFFARSGLQILLAVGLFFVWGGILFGVLPGQPGVSWQAHLFGALAGLLAARLVARADRTPRLPT